ncbi:MAG: hypothetical protein QXY52_05825 [Conexivisphaerales archaeon]
MNGSNKEGRRFVYPDSYIEFLSYLKVGLDIYRESPGRSSNTLNPCRKYASLI